MTHRIVTYSLAQDGKRYLSPAFRVSEFACRDGSDKITVDLRLVQCRLVRPDVRVKG